MWQKLKIYYRNSPKRIGWTWFLMHVFFLVVSFAVFRMGQSDSDWFRPSLYDLPFSIWIFPSSFFVAIADTVMRGGPEFLSFMVVWFLFIVYYGLFIGVLRLAKQTKSKAFLTVHTIFLLLFLLNISVVLKGMADWLDFVLK